MSSVVHALASSHPEPAALTGFEHWPVEESQVPASWQLSLAEHWTELKPWQKPLRQMSSVVHALPSVHPEPAALFGFEHWPVEVSQVPTSWHWSLD